MHEVTSPQAFEGLRISGRKVRAPEKTLLVVDHNVPTTDRTSPIPIRKAPRRSRSSRRTPKISASNISTSSTSRQGIVHIIGPEQGFTLPGTTIVCGDSHTATHGAFGALAYGIGTSEVEHVLATQTLIQKKSKNMRVMVDGKLPRGVTAKDIILAIIGEIGTAGGTGYAIEYAGEAIRALSMEGRMTVCNMSIEGGARAGMVAPDEKTYAYLKGRPKAPKGADWDDGAALLGARCTPTTARISTTRSSSTPRSCRRWSPGAPARRTSCRSPAWCPIRTTSPTSTSASRRSARSNISGLTPGTKITDIKLDRVFIGSCTNGRIEDLREVARVVDGKTVQRQRQCDDRAGLRSRERSRRKPKASTRFSSKPASNGASPAARCALR